MEIRSLSPEARRMRALAQPVRFSANLSGSGPPPGLFSKIAHNIGPGTRFFETIRRTAVGTWQDGFIHAGNLAYLSMLAIFPFFIIGAALFEIIGGRNRALEIVHGLEGVARAPRVVGHSFVGGEARLRVEAWD